MKSFPLDLEKGPDDRWRIKDAKLAVATQEFLSREFLETPQYEKFVRMWVVLDREGDVMAIGGVANRVDVPLCHISRDSVDPKEIRDELLKRMRSYLEDQGLRGSLVFVYVAPEVEKYWQGFLKGLGAEKAHRFIVEV